MEEKEQNKIKKKRSKKIQFELNFSKVIYHLNKERKKEKEKEEEKKMQLDK